MAVPFWFIRVNAANVDRENGFASLEVVGVKVDFTIKLLELAGNGREEVIDRKLNGCGGLVDVPLLCALRGSAGNAT